METFLIVLSIWVFIYWLPNFVWLIYLVRKIEDIDMASLLTALVLTALTGPFFPIKTWLEQLDERGFFDIVVFKKCTKREVWTALGGDKAKGPK